MDRIELLASLAEGTHTLADIGCDHAYTLITAIRKYGVKRGLAIEVAPGPFENARKTSNNSVYKIESSYCFPMVLNRFKHLLIRH